MTTYAILLTDVALWSAREDLTPQIPTFIRLAEARIARDIRVLDMQQATTLVADDTGAAPLPNGFLKFRSVNLADVPSLSGSAAMTYLSPTAFHELTIDRSSITGISQDGSYTIEGRSLLIAPRPGAGETIDVAVTFWQRLAAISPTVDTNWLLENNYDIYLAAVLKELNGFLMDDQQEAKWNTNYQAKVQSLHRSERGKQRSGPHVRRATNTP